MSVFDDANSALVGAEKLRELIDHALEMGSSNIKGRAYQVKSRVKSSSGIVEKVQNRRNDGELDYDVANVRDIVGFRFLTLFKQDLITLVERFVGFLEDFQNEPVELFDGDALVESVEEIIVYKSDAAGETYDSIYKMLRSYFLSRGFKEDFVRLKTKKGTGYSSVHVIALGQVFVGESVKIIPVEFQLRTVFEDIWGEIDHLLVYKNSAFRDIHEDQSRLAFGKTQLEALKVILDGCSAQADGTYFYLKPSKNTGSPQSSLKSNIVTIFEKLDEYLPSTAKQDILITRQRITDVYSELANTSKRDWGSEIVEKFQQLLGVLQSFDNKWGGQVLDFESKLPDYKYLVNMEIAAVLYWIALAKLGPAVDGGKPAQDELGQDINDLVEKSRQIYFDLCAYPKFANDPVLNYRIGQTYRILSQYETAIIYYESAVDHMSDSAWSDKNSIFEIIIPRHLGFMYWAQCETWIGDAPTMDTRQTKRDKVQQNKALQRRILRNLRKAYWVTINIDIRDVTSNPVPGRDIDEDKAVAYNNCLAYAIEYISFGGDPDKLSDNEKGADFGVEFYERLYTYFKLSYVNEVRIEMLDTFVWASIYFKDHERGKIWFNELQTRLESDLMDELDPWTVQTLTETVEEAKKFFGE